MNFLTRLKQIIHIKSKQITSIETQVSSIDFRTRCIFLEDKILNSTQSGISEERYCDRELIVSLASYGKRLREVALTIESLMQQTLRPNRIILNLDPSERNRPLPMSLKKQIKRGLTINYTEEEIRSYKKLIPVLEKYPEALIITVDDDVLYNFDVVERLFDSYLNNPDKVSALRVHTMKFDANDDLLPYNEWDMEKVTTENPRHIFPTGVGGILYPPHILSKEVFNRETYMEICQTADDVWFHAMALKNGKCFVKAASRNPEGNDYTLNVGLQKDGLYIINTGELALNDKQIKAVYEKYGIYDILKS